MYREQLNFKVHVDKECRGVKLSIEYVHCNETGININYSSIEVISLLSQSHDSSIVNIVPELIL